MATDARFCAAIAELTVDDVVAFLRARAEDGSPRAIARAMLRALPRAQRLGVREHMETLFPHALEQLVPVADR